MIGSQEVLACDWIKLTNVHDISKCRHRACVIHNPSPHHMRFWKLNWRNDRGIFERVCVHGVGHPDPDQFEYWKEMGYTSMGTHGCCGCCRREEKE